MVTERLVIIYYWLYKYWWRWFCGNILVYNNHFCIISSFIFFVGVNIQGTISIWSREYMLLHVIRYFWFGWLSWRRILTFCVFWWIGDFPIIFNVIGIYTFHVGIKWFLFYNLNNIISVILALLLRLFNLLGQRSVWQTLTMVLLNNGLIWDFAFGIYDDVLIYLPFSGNPYIREVPRKRIAWFN